MRSYYVYIATNRSKTVLYTGVTNSLYRRGREHRDGKALFTSRYRIRYLLYAEQTPYVHNAIEREKEIKGWTRRKKLALIRQVNPKLTLYDWCDWRPERAQVL